MEIKNYIIAVIIIVVTFTIVSRLKRIGSKKRQLKKLKIIAICPHCKSEIGLEKVKNFICGNCGKTVAYYNINTGIPFETTKMYDCKKCGTTNYVGIKFCTNCGEEHLLESA